jgi:hypothetical protein
MSFTRDKVPTYYSDRTSTGPLRSHSLIYHTVHYIEKAIEKGWPPLHDDIRNALALGWTLQTILEKLKQDPSCTLKSLGTPHNAAPSGTGLAASSEEIPSFSVEEMNRQLVKFIVADDQVS